MKEQSELEVTNSEVRSILKNELRLSYRIAKKVPVQGNSERCLVLRQQYALKMLDLLAEGKRVLNVDESWLNETSFTRRIWCPADAAGTVPLRTMSPRISLIAALDTEGCVYFSLTQTNTDQHVMLVFLRHLAGKLDEETPGWREDTVLLLDGATYHTGEEIRDYMRKM